MTNINIQNYDREGKVSSMSIPAADAVGDVDVQALADAVDGVTRGTDVSAIVTVPNIVDAGAPGPATDLEAQRGNKLLLRVSVPGDDDGAGKIRRHEIGCFDNTTLPSAGDDFLDLTAGVGLALKTAVDAVYQSPQGNPGTLLSAQQVNRASN